jgi:hypothetical protein
VTTLCANCAGLGETDEAGLDVGHGIDDQLDQATVVDADPLLAR